MKASTLIKTEKVVLIFPDDPNDSVPEKDRTLNVTVNGGKLTPADQQRIRAADEDDMEPLALLLSELVQEWDLLDDKGKVIKHDHATLMTQPIVVLALILNGISEDLESKAAEQGKGSVAT